MDNKENFLKLVSTEKSNTLEKIKNRRQQIIDNFTIEFVEWVRKKTAPIKGNRYKLFSDFESYNSKELLEIFKKEKESENRR